MRDTAFEYIRRDPQSTVLYRVVAEKLETFLIAAGEWRIPRPTLDRILPWVPVRQWVPSLPFKLRYRRAPS